MRAQRLPAMLACTQLTWLVCHDHRLELVCSVFRSSRTCRCRATGSLSYIKMALGSAPTDVCCHVMSYHVVSCRHATSCCIMHPCLPLLLFASFPHLSSLLCPLAAAIFKPTCPEGAPRCSPENLCDTCHPTCRHCQVGAC